MLFAPFLPPLDQGSGESARQWGLTSGQTGGIEGAAPFPHCFLPGPGTSTIHPHSSWPSPSGPRGCCVSSWPGDVLSTHGPLWPELWGKVGAGALGYIGPRGPSASPWPVGLPSATRSLLILRIPLPPDLNLCPTLGLIFPLDISQFFFLPLPYPAPAGLNCSSPRGAVRVTTALGFWWGACPDGAGLEGIVLC